MKGRRRQPAREFNAMSSAQLPVPSPLHSVSLPLSSSSSLLPTRQRFEDAGLAFDKMKAKRSSAPLAAPRLLEVGDEKCLRKTLKGGNEEQLLELFRQDEQAARRVLVGDQLALHVVAEFHGGERGERLVKHVVSANREAARHRDALGRLPLHLLCRSPSPSVNSLRLLLHVNGEGVGDEDEEGMTPLHHLMLCSGHQPCAEVLLQLCSEAARGRASAEAHRGALPLHILCRYHGDCTGTIQLLLQAFPEAAASPCLAISGYLPVHILAQFQGEAHESMAALVEGYEQGLLARSRSGKLALHLLAEFFPGAEKTMELVCRCCRKACLSPDNASMTPLHLLAAHTRAEDWQAIAGSLRALLQWGKSAVLLQDEDGNTPVHLAALLCPQPDLLLAEMLRHGARAGTMLNEDGRTPVHCLMLNPDAPISSFFHLLSISEEALLLPDADGNLPLHLLCEHNGDKEELLRAVLAAGKKEASLQNGEGKTPLHLLACSFGTDEHVGSLSALLASSPDAAEVPDGRGKLPADLLPAPRFDLRNEEFRRMLEEAVAVRIRVEEEEEASLSRFSFSFMPEQQLGSRSASMADEALRRQARRCNEKEDTDEEVARYFPCLLRSDKNLSLSFSSSSSPPHAPPPPAPCSLLPAPTLLLPAERAGCT
eukprot:765259-Hanusia_phi.AAC.2